MLPLFLRRLEGDNNPVLIIKQRDQAIPLWRKIIFAA
jgi:hypothetical protein